MRKKQANKSLPLLASLVFLLPIAFCHVHKELAHIRNWQILISVLCLPILFKLSKKPKTTFNRSSLLFCAISALLLYLVCVLSTYLAVAVNGIDFSIFDHMLLYTNWDKFMHSPFYGYSHFAVHPSWIVLPLIPFHRVIQHPLFLLMLGNFLLWAAIFPLWKLAKRNGANELTCALLCFAYLSNPFIGTVINSGFRIESFIPLMSLSFFYFWDQKKTGLWLIFLLLWLSIKEDMALYALSFFFYVVLFQKNKRKHALLAGSISLGVLLLNILWVQPYFLGKSEVFQPEYLNFWKHYGSSKSEIILTMLSSPLLVISDILHSGWWKLYAPLLSLPLFSLPIFFASLPGIFILGTASSYPAMHQYGFYYPLLLVCLAFVGMIPWHKKWMLPYILLAFPLFHAGYLRIVKPDFAVYGNLKETQAYLEEHYPQDPICVQTIAFPYLGYKLNLRPLNAKCLREKNSLALIVVGKDPYPRTGADIERMRERNSEIVAFGSVYLYRNLSKFD